jgi:hypothetical protein
VASSRVGETEYCIDCCERPPNKAMPSLTTTQHRLNTQDFWRDSFCLQPAKIIARPFATLLSMCRRVIYDFFYSAPIYTFLRERGRCHLRWKKFIELSVCRWLENDIFGARGAYLETLKHLFGPVCWELTRREIAPNFTY